MQFKMHVGHNVNGKQNVIVYDSDDQVIGRANGHEYGTPRESLDAFLSALLADKVTVQTRAVSDGTEYTVTILSYVV